MEEKQSPQKRLVIISCAVFFLFSLLIIQFFKIQMIQGERWEKVANRQHFVVVDEPFLRGTFFSNTSLKKGHPEVAQRFAFDIEKFHLYIDPDSIPDLYKEEIASHLKSYFSFEYERQKRFTNNFYRRSRSRKLVMWLSREVKDQILSWWRPYSKERKIASNALYFLSDYQRSYPFQKMLGQVLHTVQDIKDSETKQAKPTGGLELYFQEYLKGHLGKRRLIRSPRHAFDLGQIITSPKNGADIYLTINHNLQAICEEELEVRVKELKAKGGFAVMMQPKTGEILAIAQYPFFDPQEYQSYYNDPLLIHHTRVKSVTEANEMGSIMKPLTLAIALKANKELKALGQAPIFDPETKMKTSNPYFKGRRTPLKDTRLHYFLNLPMALQKSSNIYMARLSSQFVDRLGEDWYRNQLVLFGLGQKTGVELPAESAGKIPTPGKLHPNGRLEWSRPTPYSLAIGYNIQVSALQVVRAYAVLANGGYLVKPTLVRKIVSEEGRKILLDHTDQKRLKQFPQVLDKEIADQIVKAMKYVTKPGGGGFRADVSGYSEAGKTGTARKIIQGKYSNKHHTASFVGFTPVENPEFVLLVSIDEPEEKGSNYYGSVAAAPLFKRIAERSLEYFGTTPDDPYGYPIGDARRNSQKADWMAESQKLKKLYLEWNQVKKR